jgi:uncharacterized membrane protein YidH (DUF202 family)
VKNMLYAVVGLIATGVAVWQIWAFIQVQKGETANNTHIIVGIICAIVALICGGLFLSGRVNRQEEIHITE